MSLPIPLVMVTLDYTQGSTKLRAAMSLALHEREDFLRALRREGMQGFVQIATCNRTVWLTTARHPEWAGQLLEAQAMSRWQSLIERGGPRVRPRLFVGRDAVEEMMRIAVGLRSFVLGERQVSGQVHRAFADARARDESHPLLNMLDTALGRVVRRVHRLTGYGVDAAGLHTVTADRLNAELGPSARRGVRVIGAGEIGQAIAGRLVHHDWSPRIANRTVNEGDIWTSLENIRAVDDDVVALVVATGARDPIWSVEDLPPKVRSGEQPLLIVDVGSPAQVDVEVSSLANVRLLQLDDLLQGARPHLDPGIVVEAETEVGLGVQEYRQRLVRQAWSGAWRVHQEATENIAKDSLPACLERHGIAPDDALRSSLEEDLRQLITRYGHRLLDAMAEGMQKDMAVELGPQGESEV